MGRYLFEFIIPGVAVLAATFWGVKWLWLRRFGKTIDTVNEVKQASRKYGRQWNEGNDNEAEEEIDKAEQKREAQTAEDKVL